MVNFIWSSVYFTMVVHSLILRLVKYLYYYLPMGLHCFDLFAVIVKSRREKNSVFRFFREQCFGCEARPWRLCKWFASADGKTSAADRFICRFGQHQEDFDCQTKNMSLKGRKEKEMKKFINFDKNLFLKLISFFKGL